jgi:ATP-dependent DNA helicase RecG
MWANSPDGGLIVSGQHDEKQRSKGFEGCSSLSPLQLNRLEKCGEVFCPDARYDSKRVPVVNISGGKDFVIVSYVRYHPSLVVRTSNGKVFIRRGDSKIELGPDEVRELQADKGEVSFEQQPCDLKWPDDFKHGAAAQFAEAVRTARAIPESHSLTEILELRRLGRIRSGKFEPNVACALLFARDPMRVIPGCKVRFQRFEGEQEGTGGQYNAVKDFFIEGTVPEIIRQLEEALESQLRTFSPLNAKGKFFPLPEYPKPAWYEAVINACVHRSYGNGMKNLTIFVKMFDDRLEVESPGAFPPSVTSSNIYDSHHPRNPHLMDAMFYLDYVKCAHEGTRRIRDTMKKMSLPAPEFIQSDSGLSLVTVKLRNDIKQRRAWLDRDVSKIVSEAIAADLSENERRVLNWAAEHGMVTITDTHTLLKISWQSARKLLLKLTDKRILQYIRFRPFEKDRRDPKAFFRLRSTEPIPEGASEQKRTGH